VSAFSAVPVGWVDSAIASIVDAFLLDVVG
jgi:hypothetical protein